jgi:hypothetical protein
LPLLSQKPLQRLQRWLLLWLRYDALLALVRALEALVAALEALVAAAVALAAADAAEVLAAVAEPRIEST